MEPAGSRNIGAIGAGLAPVFEFLVDSEWARRQGDPTINDFVVGNPHEMPLPGVTDAILTHAVPKDKDWYAYKLNEDAPRAVVVASLAAEGIQVDAEDVFLTPGSFGALSVSIRALVDPGDEVVFVSPPWFFYESMILSNHGVPVRVKAEPPGFDLPVQAIAEAIGPRTRAVLLNSPHNPTGRIFPDEDVRALADVLNEASERNGRPVFLLSDESYRRILFDGAAFTSPAMFYPRTLVLYTYGKTLLAPGERIGYIALPTSMAEREALRESIFVSQLVGGFQFPTSTLQRALGDLEHESIDLAALQRRRDTMCEALRGFGYDLSVPEGTFYITVRSPLEDDRAFCRLLAGEDVFCLPGTTFELPGYFRISLTANDEMVARGLPGFERALKRALDQA